MNLKGLFQRLRLPKKGGKGDTKSSGKRTVSRFYLQFTNIEDSPSYPLDNELSVGSEVGDIVIEDPSLSPRHATFALKDGLVTVTDLGSAEGTSVGDHALTRGKAVILKAGDELNLGQLEVTLVEEQEEVEEEELEESAEEAPPELVVKATEESTGEVDASVLNDEAEESAETIELEAEDDNVERPEDKIKKRLEEIRSKTKGKPSGLHAIGGGVNKAANTLPRVVGFILDVFLALTVWNILSPFDEFRLALEVVPRLLQDEVLPFIEFLITEQGFGKEYQLGMKSFLDLVSEAESELFLSYIVSLFFTLRILSTFLFGVSLGSWLAGVRSYGNVLWKRIGGVLREVLGPIMLPLVLPDITTLFSRRSLKEVLTFTHLYTPSKGVVLISWLLFTPLCMALYFVSPLFSGLEPTEPVIVTESFGKKTKKSEEAVVEKIYSSHWFGAQFTLNESAWRVLPRFSWSQEVGKGRTLTPTLVFYHQQGTTIPLVLHKTFDWAKLLGVALSHNPLLQNNFPGLWSYVQAQKLKKSSSIKYQPSAGEKLTLHAELQELLKTAFALSPENIVEHVQSHGPLLKGLVEFRRALFQLIGAPAEGSWNLVRYGKSTMLVHEVLGVKPFDLIVPLVIGQGRLFKVSYASAKERNNANKVARGELWNHSVWDLAKDATIDGTPYVIDVVAEIASGINADDAAFERVYGSLFDAVALVISLPPEDQARGHVLQAIKNLIEVLQRLAKVKSLSPTTLEGMEKLRVKLTEMQAQFEASNTTFFVNETPVGQ